MSGSPASALSEQARILVCGVNWIGDAVMSMPALQLYRARHPGHHLTLLVKPALAPLWALHEAVDAIETLRVGPYGTLATAAALRRAGFDATFVLPHSIRSALIPFLAGLPRRRGLAGPGRFLLAPDIARHRADPARYHQAWEYMDLLVPEAEELPPPRLRVSAEARAAAERLLGGWPRPLIALLPGAARGESKRWPAAHFAAVGRHFAADRNAGLVILGGPAERELAQDVMGRLGGPAMDLTGRTTLPEWAAVLAACDLVVCNDSGGMHLAAAVGTPLVAIFGLTDPRKTGPLSGHCRLLQAGEGGRRDIPRYSDEARKRLETLSPDAVYEAARALLDAGH